MDINGKDLQALICRAVRQVLEEEAARQIKRRIYVVFADSFDGPNEVFLQELPEKDEVVFVVPDDWSPAVRKQMKKYAPACRILDYTVSADLPLEGSLTIYPAASRTFAAKAALCIADTFPLQWLERCLSEGAAVHLMLSGLQQFSGKEQPCYVEQILSYYRRLLQYGISIGDFPEAEESPVQAAEPIRTVRGRIITAGDIDAFGSGTVISIEAGAIVTAYAQEAAERKNIRFITT